MTIRIHAPTATVAFLVCLPICCYGQKSSGKAEGKQSPAVTKPQATDRKSPAAASKAEEYQPVDPSELECRLMGFDGATEIGEGGVRILNGTFDKFLCQGIEIAVTTNNVEAGIITTKEFGKIRIASRTFGGLTVYMTPSQKKKLMGLKKPSSNK